MDFYVNSIYLEPRSVTPDVVMQCTKNCESKKAFIDEIVECFSLRNNIEILTNVQKPSNAVPIVDGLKYENSYIFYHIHFNNRKSVFCNIF